MSDFSERVDFIIDYIGDKLNEKDWREEQIKEFIEIQISKFNAEFKECEKIINRIERLKSEGKINSNNYNEFKDDEKSFRLKMRSSRDDINFLKMLKLETPDIINKMRSLKSDNLIQPIHWPKGEESLRQFLDIIKSAGLIESRETDEIIQEHFYVDGKMPTKEPQPINWLKSKVLLAYLIQELSTKPNMYKPFIEPDKKWQLTELHFTVKGKEIGRSLVNDIKQSRLPNGCEEIDSILKRLTKH